jgi:hypothetical protein
MTLHEYPDVIQGTDEWFDQRRGMVTASVVGQLITVRTLTAIEFACPSCEAAAGNPCRSVRSGTDMKTLHPERVAVARDADLPPIIEPASNPESRALIAQLAAERITGWTEDNYVSFDMQRGHDDEPRARDFYTEHRAPVRECGFMVLDRNGWRLGFSPDGLVDPDGLIEVKSRRARKQIPLVIAGEVPAEHMPQIQAGLLVTSRAWCDYVSWSGGLEFWTVRVYPDPGWQEAIVAAVTAAEVAIEDMVAAYKATVSGLPMTERTVLEVVI